MLLLGQSPQVVRLSLFQGLINEEISHSSARKSVFRFYLEYNGAIGMLCKPDCESEPLSVNLHV